MKNRIPFVILFIYFLNLVPVQSQSCPELDSIPELKGSVCFTAKAPLNYKAGDTSKIELFIRKFPAVQERKGSIWLIPGGPGESGASMYPLIDQFSKLFPNLDIFIPDHRGTGYSSKLCPQEEAVDSPDGMALVNDEWGSCFNYMYTNLDYVKSFTITNAAKDLSLLINTYSGSGERYIYGVSYGTQLVLRLLQLETVAFDAVLLDSLVPHQEDVAYDLSHRSLVTNDVGLSLLQDLDQRNSNEESLKTQLKAILERAKTDTAFGAQLPKQDLTILLGMMLDLPTVRNTIPEIIKGLQDDNFDPLQQATQQITSFYTDYGAAYPSATNSIPLTQVITASENNLRPEMTKAEVALESEELLFKSPLPNLIAENSMPTYTRDTYFGKTPSQLPPTLVINGTLDPKTHIDGAERHYKLLAEKNPSVSFVRVQNAPHFIALFAPHVFDKVVTEFVNKGAIKNQTVTEQSLLID
ncbi:alpha/beta hydrolase family protein [Leeuwenhoekiella aestuarii]|uniref:Alpha/beta hydrolase family protein n=1 Tax=Leeuwenhoekiella aestuarii TaxID=2249426 RepID=A0A4Q0NWX8_9FLAO|nr:alpha/beta fold hydrolase [Leeuwenhoekiella aestuarii]RXG15956.1 alpha/beta hydrolase family protein [Leeuwenhoekiella aestuarii]RXG16650.1 alpha/beta hydrolase family protein [Leeuwenhoekiella aestuarii]